MRECRNIDDESMVYLKQLQQLRELAINGDTNRWVSDTEWVAEIAWRFPGSRIDVFDQYCGGITDAGLAHLCEMTKLESLSIAKTLITDAGLADLPRLEELRRLDLSRTAITDASVMQITQLKNLESLSIAFTLITDDGLRQLSTLENLRHLSVTGTCVTDAGLAHLARLPRLQVLDLTYCQITDAGLDHLANSDTLERVRLRQTEVTLRGLRKLTAELPQSDLALMLRDWGRAGDESDTDWPSDYCGGLCSIGCLMWNRRRRT
jgi:Leucine-rich repeat (LRR) protein